MLDPSVSSLSFDAIVLLSLLSNYKKYEIANPYLSGLSKIKDGRILNVCCLRLVIFDWIVSRIPDDGNILEMSDASLFREPYIHNYRAYKKLNIKEKDLKEKTAKALAGSGISCVLFFKRIAY